ncbi:hypothetical protein ACFE04_013888 [Oxalis oulophora]
MLGYISNIRTFICPKLGSETFFNTCLSKCKSLRVLNLESSSLEVLPYSIGTLKQLRFLNLSESKRIKKLPNSLCKLHSLQFLYISGCSELEELPKDMKYMISLRVLALTTKQKSLSETGIECLKSLRTLALEDCKNLEYLFAGMECPPALETLAICNCPMLISLPRALKCLTSLKNLLIDNCQELDLKMKFESEDDHQDVNIMLSIRMLVICHLPELINLPSWLLRGSLKSLEVIQLDDCENLNELPESLPSFTSLEELYISRCPSLETLPRGMKRLTSLKKLCMAYCESLNLTEENDKDQLSESKLEKLAIVGLPKLKTLPKWLLQWSMLSLETLWITDCQRLKMMPAVIQSLTSLKNLYIINCPLLIESCKTGEDFHRIAHVEKIITITNYQENLQRDMECLPALQTLFIANSPSLTSLPRGLKCLTSLTTLATIGFGGCRELNLEINSESEDDHLDVNNLLLESCEIATWYATPSFLEKILKRLNLEEENDEDSVGTSLRNQLLVLYQNQQHCLDGFLTVYIVNGDNVDFRCETGTGEDFFYSSNQSSASNIKISDDGTLCAFTT